MLFFPDCSTAIRGAPRHVAGAPRFVAGALSYSEGRQECPPRVRYSPEIDASKFTLHILSHTAGGFQWLIYILLMLCNGKHVILRQRVRGSVRAVRAVQNTRVFLMETRVVADVSRLGYLSLFIRHSHIGWMIFPRVIKFWLASWHAFKHSAIAFIFSILVLILVLVAPKSCSTALQQSEFLTNFILGS